MLNPLLPFLTFFSPLQATFMAILCGFFTLPLLAAKYSLAACIFLLLSGFFDTLDGTLARHKKLVTSFGTVLDITGDRLVEFSLILGLYLFQPEARGLACICMLGSVLLCVTSFLVVGIFTENQSEKSFHYSPGLIERAEAFIFFLLMILFPEWFFFLALLFSLTVFLTVLVRLWEFWENCHKS